MCRPTPLQYEPAGQGKHDDWPVLGWYVPWEQAVCAVAPVPPEPGPSAKLPDWAARHEVWPCAGKRHMGQLACRLG